MSKDNERNKTSYEQQYGSTPHGEYAICLHCNNPFSINRGVVTPDAAICDTCNGR